MNKHKIVVEIRPNDYIAYIDGSSKIFGCGCSRDVALCDLITTHQGILM